MISGLPSRSRIACSLSSASSLISRGVVQPRATGEDLEFGGDAREQRQYDAGVIMRTGVRRAVRRTSQTQSSSYISVCHPVAI